MKRAVSLIAFTAVIGFVATAAVAQSQSLTPEELTRMLNGSPATQVTAQPAAAVTPAALPKVEAPVAASAAVAAQPKREEPAIAAAPALAVAPQVRSRNNRPMSVAPAVPAAQASADLPFRIDLQGAEIVERAAGPGAKIYSVRRGSVPLLMIYSGPQSQYPIYEGEQVVAGGRYSIVVTQDGKRNALEHLFRKDGAEPWDLHIWLVATEGADGAFAEQMAQGIEPR